MQNEQTGLHLRVIDIFRANLFGPILVSLINIVDRSL